VRSIAIWRLTIREFRETKPRKQTKREKAQEKLKTQSFYLKVIAKDDWCDQWKMIKTGKTTEKPTSLLDSGVISVGKVNVHQECLCAG